MINLLSQLTNNYKKYEESQDFKNKSCCSRVFCAFLTAVCTQVSFLRPTRAVIATLCQAVKLVTYFLRRRTDAVSLTLQSALKHYYPPVILLIPQKHPVVTGNVVQALDRTWYRMWYHTAVSVSLTDDTPINISSLWLVSCGFYLIYSCIFYVLACHLYLLRIYNTADHFSSIFSRLPVVSIYVSMKVHWHIGNKHGKH